MRYCTACLIPDSRPNGALGPDGLCTACEFGCVVDRDSEIGSAAATRRVAA